jgi:predicted CoA-substrate-specific enzyme activase
LKTNNDQISQLFAGIDIGSTMTKVVIMDDSIVASVVKVSSPEHRKLAHKAMEEALDEAKRSFDDITYVVATGYGRINVPFADKQITEISCHGRGVSSLLPSVKTVIDIGGQDCKGISLRDGNVVDFVMNDKCAAGTGRFIEKMAEGLGIALEDFGELSLESKNDITISDTCTVFAEQEVVTQLARGVQVNDLAAGVHRAIATRIVGMLNRIKIENDIAITGGGAKNKGLVKAIEKRIGSAVIVPPDPLLTAAIGAALLGKEIVQKCRENGTKVIRSRHRLQEIKLFTEG